MPAPSLCVISGTVYDENGVPAVGVTLYLKRVLLNGVLIGTAPIGSVSFPSLSGGDQTVFYIEAITSNASGVISFTVPQLSTIYLEGNVSGYNNGEVALSIPATATATLESLTPATFPIDVTTFTFLSLVDTPDDFTGDALKVARVNAAETAIEFATISVSVTAEEVQDALATFFPDVAPFDWTYDDAGDRVTLAILDATASARGLMSTAYAARLDSLSLTAGSIPFAVAGGLLGQDNANLFFDDTNNRLKLGNPSTSPINAPLMIQVDGSGRGFVIVNSATEYTDFVSGGVSKGMRGIGTVPFVITNAGDVLLQAGASSAFSINTNGASERLRIDLAGLVGVNKSSSIAAQLHTLSNAIGVIPLIAEGPAGQTANLFEARVNGVAKVLVSAAGGLETNSTTILNQDAFRISVGFHAALWNGGRFQWSSTTASGGAVDTGIGRQAAGVIQVGDGAANANGKVRAAEYQVAAIKVIGAQGAAVADATDNPSAITQLNALLARLRAHGLIAT